MTRTAAREIAVHFAFELGFTNQTAEELLAEALNRKTFEQIGEEEPLYAEFPNEKQREYISKLVKGVYEPVSYTHLDVYKRQERQHQKGQCQEQGGKMSFDGRSSSQGCN